MFLHRYSKTGNVAADGTIASRLNRDDGGRSAPAYERGETMKPNIGMTDEDRDGVGRRSRDFEHCTESYSQAGKA